MFRGASSQTLLVMAGSRSRAPDGIAIEFARRNPPAGAIAIAGEPKIEFDGWLDLLRVLSGLLDGELDEREPVEDRELGVDVGEVGLDGSSGDEQS